MGKAQQIDLDRFLLMLQPHCHRMLIIWYTYFFVQMSNPLPCFLKFFSGVTGIFLWNCAWTVSLFHWTTSRQGWACSKTIFPLIVSLCLSFCSIKAMSTQPRCQPLHQTLMWHHRCKGAQAVVFLSCLSGEGFYMKNPEKAVHTRSPCWVFLEHGVFSVCKIKPCLNLANKECLGKLIGP